MRKDVPGATASVSETSDAVARALLTGSLSNAMAGVSQPTTSNSGASRPCLGVPACHIMRAMKFPTARFVSSDV
jgi:hypothetical protein